MKGLLRIVLIVVIGSIFLSSANASESSWDLLLAQSQKYLAEEDYRKALATGEQALILAEKIFYPDHINISDSMFNLAEIHRMSGNYYSSEPHYYGALKIRERFFGREHVHVAACFYGLAEIMTVRGEYRLAQNYADQALAIFQKTNGPDSVDIGKVYRLLAETGKGQFQLEKAESFGTKALEILEKAAGPTNLSTGKALVALASIRIKQENYLEALSLLQRADLIYMEAYRKKRLDTGYSLYYQAETTRLQGDPKKAQGLYKKALKYFEKRSDCNPGLGKTLIALAGCYKNDLKYTKAEKLHREGLAILSGSLGNESIILEEPIGEMVELLVLNRNYQQAGQFAYQLVKIREQIYGIKDLRVGNGLNRLAGIYIKTNRLTEAEFLCLQASNITESAGEAGVSEKATTLLYRAQIGILQGSFPAAQSNLGLASDLVKKLAQGEPSLTIDLAATEAALNMAQGNYLTAEPLLQKAIIEAEQFYGLLHPKLAELLKQMSVLYNKQGRIKEAEAMEKQANKIYSKIS